MAHYARLFFITFGMALYALGFCGFILPEKVVIGGLAGIGTIVYFTTGIPVAITQYALNLILLAIAYKVVGKRFVLGTIYGATMIPCLWAYSSRYSPRASRRSPSSTW